MFHKGQKVRTHRFYTSATFDGEILSIYDTINSPPYAIVVDSEGQPHHRWLHELEAIEGAQA